MPGTERPVRITDTTLRDGSHAMSHQFTEAQVRATVHALDRAGVEVIECSHGDGIGGSSFNYGFSRTDEMTLIRAAYEEATQAKIAILLVPGIGTMDDLRNAREAGASVARIATHCTEADVSVQHFGLARSLGMETVGFLMMSHRTSPEELARQARFMVDAGAECVYAVDSAGALVMDEAKQRIAALHAEVGQEAQRLGVDVVVAVGPLSRGYGGVWYADAGAAVDGIDSVLRPGDAVLVKASRAAGLEAIVEALA